MERFVDSTSSTLVEFMTDKQIQISEKEALISQKQSRIREIDAQILANEEIIRQKEAEILATEETMRQNEEELLTREACFDELAEAALDAAVQAQIDEICQATEISATHDELLRSHRDEYDRILSDMNLARTVYTQLNGPSAPALPALTPSAEEGMRYRTPGSKTEV